MRFLLYHAPLVHFHYTKQIMAMAPQLCCYQHSSTFTHTTISKTQKTFHAQISKPSQSSIHLRVPLSSMKEMCKQGNLEEAFRSFNHFVNDENLPRILPDEVYSSMLELCATERALAQGQQIHAHLLTSSLVTDSVFLSTKLVFMYGKCGSLSDAQKLFGAMSQRTVFTWNAIIGAYVSNAEPLSAIELYREMRELDTAVDACTFPSVLKACGVLKDLYYGTEIHGVAIKCGFISNVFVVNALVSMYAKCDAVNQATQLFVRMKVKEDVVSWNAIISACSSNGHALEALKLFRKMQKAGVPMNSFTVVGALQACEDPSFLKFGREIHAALFRSNRELGVFELNALVVMYTRCGRINEARQVFNRMRKDSVTWNSMLSGFFQNGLYAEAVGFFRQMLQSGHKTDQVAVISIASASGRLGNLLNGMEVHAYALKHGLDSDLQVGNALLGMYAKCCCVNYMNHVFDKMADKDLISWTTIIAGMSQNQCYTEALELFRKVQMTGMKVDAMMVGSALLACSGLRNILHVKELHANALRQGLFDYVLQNTVVDIYGECGEVEYASRVFDLIEKKDVVSWTSMMSSYIHNGFANEALEIFYNMRELGIEPDMVALLSLLSASASLSALKKGKEIHGYLIRKGFALDGSMASSLVDMYARCGSICESFKVFNQIQNQDLVLWTSMINASGMHGQGKEAVDLFKKMRETGLTPDHITFLALLYACSHSGLIEEGIRYLKIMENEYRLEPWPEHYACVVDLLGRANRLNDAYNFVRSMPIEPTAAVWCALLGACRIHSNKELGEIAARRLLEMDPENPGNYVLVSNVFASTGRWTKVDEVRNRMKEKGMRKNPACSWIEIGNKVHTFMVRDTFHPKTEEIYSKLAQITERIEKEGGYVPETKYVLHNIPEDEKIKMLYGHSERLAIAFGLLETPPGTPIRITKNLRVCGDCHVFTKLVAKLFEREIIVRDANRFHHFNSGVCSCGEFW